MWSLAMQDDRESWVFQITTACPSNPCPAPASQALARPIGRVIAKAGPDFQAHGGCRGAALTSAGSCCWSQRAVAFIDPHRVPVRKLGLVTPESPACPSKCLCTCKNGASEVAHTKHPPPLLGESGLRRGHSPREHDPTKLRPGLSVLSG